jgi:hypothetical protein
MSTLLDAALRATKPERNIAHIDASLDQITKLGLVFSRPNV